MATNGGDEDRLGVKRAHPARLYDFYLGGKTNYPADRETAAEVLGANPNAMVAARENRAFMHRAVRYVVEQHGIRQFVDIGTGIPTEPNLHQVAQRFAPDARVVYTDNDPIVLTYARALLTGTREGRTDYIDADVREPERILEQADKTLDLSRPACLSVVALFHFVGDDADPHGLTQRLLDAMAPGSALILSHATEDFDPEGATTGTMRELGRVYRSRGMTLALRDKATTERFFHQAGTEIADPGLAPSHEWRTELEIDQKPRLVGMVDASEVGVWAGVGIKS
ncbi:SAM-dependent methyltransferase [Streptomyces xiaopingdaonensis]|uniref:SAM-dependent methyltransferase n=1 Tax=Streptomyces xiaopingdaonensis TaxID=1565415 RepID=UPI0002E2FDBA|nr:SAM-dependent methyltransferase [Streptomyces xiaopingdaonensis]